MELNQFSLKISRGDDFENWNYIMLRGMRKYNMEEFRLIKLKEDIFSYSISCFTEVYWSQK